MAATDTTTPDGAKVVEGSDGLLLEVDGRIVPNYDATITPFEEGDVVTGKVVRIDADEVLVDIGYKSEGVIPAHELSIRKSVDPSEEVELTFPCSVRDLLLLLADRHGAPLRNLLLTEDGSPQPTILVFIRDEQVALAFCVRAPRRHASRRVSLQPQRADRVDLGALAPG